ncbi:hypothetical protein [Sedimentibacter sp.]|uniref:hypothetical protein n=1 Tax=Sedimentibacter sp. TaxID=1960295 RepID=UPI0028AF1807|nr:hypothetical protein [Sedimentibacter sp.]
MGNGGYYNEKKVYLFADSLVLSNKEGGAVPELDSLKMTEDEMIIYEKALAQ